VGKVVQRKRQLFPKIKRHMPDTPIRVSKTVGSMKLLNDKGNTLHIFSFDLVTMKELDDQKETARRDEEDW
jgi:hypothetical protein